MKIEVFCDGSATIATKPGGFGWVLVVDGVKHSEGNGHLEKATNNDAEMEALIHGMIAAYKFSHQPVDVLGRLGPVEITLPEVYLCSDSEIALGWADGTYRYKKNVNTDRYKLLLELVRRLNAKTQWVKGHNGNEHNERCDRLANLGRKGLKEEPPKTPKKSKKQPQSPNLDHKSPKIGKKLKGTICLWYKNSLKVVSLSDNVIEDYDESVHGKRESYLEVK
jgi:ribonuclease HI